MLRIWIYGRCLLSYSRYGELKRLIDIVNIDKIDRLYYCRSKMYLYIQFKRESYSKKLIDKSFKMPNLVLDIIYLYLSA